jgi:flagellar motor protein MotB
MFAVAKPDSTQRLVQRRQSIGSPAPRARTPAPASNAAWAGLALGGRMPLGLSRPGDASEREADRVADAVMRAPDGLASPRPVSQSGELSSFAGPLGSGVPLDGRSRAFFEPRLDRPLGDVRIHAGTNADHAAADLRARAFTVGPHVVFAAGEYNPASEGGRRLLAHELAHVVQQTGGAPRVQRALSVDPTPPADPLDPLASMPPAAFRTFAFAEMGSIVHSLCDRFTVNATGDVVAAPGACDDADAVASGSRPIGCCCLCTLTSPSSPWTIHVTGLGGPRTVPASPGGDFFLHPRTSNVQFGNWNVGGTREMADPVVVAGHELCGHGALMELDVHPDEVERVDTDVHDPTVKVQNQIQAEQGLPGTDRGLATDAHRGESLARITVRDFPFNVSTVASLPSAERAKIQLAKDFINTNNTWVDVFGHSDAVGSAAAKLAISQDRANAVRAALTSAPRPVPATISRTFTSTGTAGTGTVTVAGNRFTAVRGQSDFDAIPGAAAADLRRVDIDMPTRPAGAEAPNPGTPTAVGHVGPRSLLSFVRRRVFGNACEKLLTKSAWG